MDYKEFIEKFSMELSRRAGIPMDQMIFKMVEKRNLSNEDILYVVLNKQVSACGFAIRRMYERLGCWGTFNKMVEEAFEAVKELQVASLYDDSLKLKAYDQIRNGLFVKVLSTVRDSPQISGVVHKMLGDVCFCVYWRYIMSDGEWIIHPVTEDMVVNWGITENHLLTDALQMSLHADPPRAYLCEKLLRDKNYEGEEFMHSDVDFEKIDGTLGICLSNKSKKYGATSIFQPGVAERLSKLLGEDIIYILISSSFEVMVYSGTMEIMSLRCILNAHNSEMPQEGVSTSSCVFEYSRKTHKFVCHSFVDAE